MLPTDPTWLLSQHTGDPPHPMHLPSRGQSAQPRLKGSQVQSSLEPVLFSVILGFSLACFPRFYTQTCRFFLSSTECRIIKKFELQSEEKKKKMNESISAVSDNFAREKEVTGSS